MEHLEERKRSRHFFQPCTVYSQMHTTNEHTRDPDKWSADVELADEMLRFAVKVARDQMYKGSQFVQEQPRHAKSCGRTWMYRLDSEDGVIKVDLDMCEVNLFLHDELGPDLAKHPTSILTNSTEIAKAMEKRCKGGHWHVQVKDSSRCKKAVAYPKDFRKAACTAIMEQKMCDEGPLGSGVHQQGQVRRDKWERSWMAQRSGRRGSWS